MGVKGAQDFWRVGGRAFFKRDAVGGVPQPVMDLGVVTDFQPNFETELQELFDPSGGTKTLVERAVSDATEEYTVSVRNCSLANQAILYQANPPEEFTQAATQRVLTHKAFPGHLMGLIDGDGKRIHGIDIVSGLASAAVSGGVLSQGVVVALAASTRTISVTGDITSHLSPGDSIILESTDLANIANARSYTVESSSFDSTNTLIVVVETVAADESSITGSLIYAASGDTGTVYEQGVDWEPVDLARGMIRIMTGGAISAITDLTVVYTPKAITGKRLIRPQTSVEAFNGDLELYWERDNFGRRAVRKARCSISPSNFATPDSEHATIELTIAILRDTNSTTEPAGTFLEFQGDLPADS